MKKGFVLIVAVGFLLCLTALGLSYTVDLGEADGVTVKNNPEQYRMKNVVVSFDGNETVYDVLFEWDCIRCALIPVELTEIVKPVVPKECDHHFYRIFHKKECAGWVKPDNGGGGNVGHGCGTTWKSGDWNYCRNCGPCKEGQGGCQQTLHECAEGLFCDPETHKCVKK